MGKLWTFALPKRRGCSLRDLFFSPPIPFRLKTGAMRLGAVTLVMTKDKKSGEWRSDGASDAGSKFGSLIGQC